MSFCQILSAILTIIQFRMVALPMKIMAAGIVEISGLPNGRYVITQIQASSGYRMDKLPKIVEITDQSSNSVATFNNIASQQGEQNKNKNNSRIERLQ